VGNAVKDSMLCKVSTETERALFVVYGSRALASAKLEACSNQLCELLQRHLGATDLISELVPS